MSLPKRLAKISLFLALGLGVLGLLLFFPVIERSFEGPTNEVAYSMELTNDECGSQDADSRAEQDCTSLFELAVGNTGNIMQERVTISVDPAPRLWTHRHDVDPIVPTLRQADDPVISNWVAFGARTYELRQLRPNQMVIWEISVQGVVAQNAMRNATVAVTATGTLVNDHPQSVAASLLTKLIDLLSFQSPA